jgi:class 3 adenylate cyclase/tetratricopeptide (TPR) repeat protein
MTGSVVEWLTAHGLEKYAPLFVEHEIDLATLSILSDGDLQELGLPFGPRKRIIAALAEAGKPALPTTAGERRQVTALFCDIVGFTQMAHRIDPEDLQVIARRYEDACAVCVTRYDGYVYQRLGDGIVAIFGFPLTYEGEAERAIHAGLEIIETLAGMHIPEVGRLSVRIGIATGIVVIASGEQNLVGETLNIAARLQSCTEPGTILVSRNVHDLARGTFEYEDVGTLDLKGISKPTQAFRIIGKSDAATRFDAASAKQLAPMVGRDKEIGSLIGQWERVESEHVGQAAVLAGEPGIGKSRLMNAFHRRLAGQGIEPVQLQCSPFYTNSSYYPIIVAVERLCGLQRDDPADAKLAKLERFVVGHLGRPEQDLRFLAAMMSIPYEERYGAVSIPLRVARLETIRSLIDVLKAMAGSGSRLLSFEDVHWADPSTLEVLDRLFEALDAMPVMILVTHRPDLQPDWARHERVQTITLPKLTPTQSRHLITEVASGRKLPETLTRQITERGEGVPLFVEELTKTVLNSGDLVADGASFTYSGRSAHISLPETLRDLLMARLDQSLMAKRVAQVGAVVGREFRYELLAALDLFDEQDLQDGLSQLTTLELAFCHGTIPRAVYTFKHALVQDTANESLLKSERKRIHAKVATVLEEHWSETRDAEPELLAHHCTEGGLVDKAVHYWKLAGESAHRRFALAEAIAYLHTGMELLETLPASPSRDLAELGFRTLLGPMVIAQHGWGHGRIAEILEPAWTLAESLTHRESYIPILNSLGVHYFSIVNITASLHCANKLLDAGGASGDGDLVIVGHRAAAASYYWMGKFELALEHGDTLREIYDPERHWHLAQLTNTDPFTGEGIYRGQFLWMMGYPDQARAASDAKDENARRRNHPFDLAFALTLGAQLFDYLGEPDELLKRTEEAEQVASRHGVALLSEMLAEISRGVVSLRAGRHGDSAVQLDNAITRLESTGHRIWISYLRALHAEALANAGEVEAAMGIIDNSIARIENSEERAHYAEVLRLKGWMHLQLDELDAAERLLRRSMATAREQNARSWELRSATTLAHLMARRGEGPAARALLSGVYGWFTEGFGTRDLVAAKALLDCLES